MKIIVTGSEGLVGTNLTKKLTDLGHKVYGLDLITGCDLNNHAEVANRFKEIHPQAVYHLAANAAESRGQISPIDMTKQNSGIFVNVLTEAINSKVQKFLYTSSVAVYGEAPVPYMEAGPTLPEDIYGINKLACEQMLKVMSKVHGLTYTIFRPHNIYGPGQCMTDPYRNVVALFMRRLLESQPYNLYDEGKMRRSFSYVDDVVEVLASALDDRFNNITLNVGSNHDISVKELSDLIQSVSGIKAEISYLPARKQEIMLFLADHTIQNSLVAYHETPIKEGLYKTWEWVKDQELLPIITKKDEICSHQ